jgi:hypothetical protein
MTASTTVETILSDTIVVPGSLITQRSMPILS